MLIFAAVLLASVILAVLATVSLRQWEVSAEHPACVASGGSAGEAAYSLEIRVSLDEVDEAQNAALYHPACIT